jgi:threonine dehydrogenase-like Zn-dependent dehydrogenase
MKAAYMLDGDIEVGEIADPIPVAGQALVRTCCCGLCASDAHFLAHAREAIDLSRKYGGLYADIEFERKMVPGHEFVGEVVDYGPGSLRVLRPGTKVTSAPVLRTPGGRAVIGHSHDYPGGFGEYMLLDETRLMAVPDGLPDEMAAMTEPLSTGLEHARVGEPKRDDVCLVVGCGAIGLGVIAGLKLMGMGPIVAADFDPARRAVALRMGADVIVDPREESPYEAMHGLGKRRATLVYECVGRPGMLGEIMRSVGFDARIVVGGFCMEAEEIYIPSGQMKRLSIQFASGADQHDLDLALRSIANGKVDVAAWLGPAIGLGRVGDSLRAMADPGAPIRTVVDPGKS